MDEQHHLIPTLLLKQFPRKHATCSSICFTLVISLFLDSLYLGKSEQPGGCSCRQSGKLGKMSANLMWFIPTSCSASIQGCQLGWVHEWKLSSFLSPRLRETSHSLIFLSATLLMLLVPLGFRGRQDGVSWAGEHMCQ